MDIKHIRESCVIPGIMFLHIPVFPDNLRGPLNSSYKKSMFVEAGGPDDFHIVQTIMAENQIGATRGIHIGPGRKYLSLLKGKAFCAFVDTRKGLNFGKKFEITIDNTIAIFLPEGIGNSYQALENRTEYYYLVDKEYDDKALGVSLADPMLDIQWPIPLKDAKISEKDLHLPYLHNLFSSDSKELS